MSRALLTLTESLSLLSVVSFPIVPLNFFCHFVIHSEACCPAQQFLRSVDLEEGEGQWAHEEDSQFLYSWGSIVAWVFCTNLCVSMTSCSKATSSSLHGNGKATHKSEECCEDPCGDFHWSGRDHSWRGWFTHSAEKTRTQRSENMRTYEAQAF